MSAASWPTLGLAPADEDQAPRLWRFRREHPDVVIGSFGFGAWQARIREPSGESVFTRHRLRDLLDKLDACLGPPGR